MNKRTAFAIATVPIVLLLVGTVASKAQAWDGGYGYQGWHGGYNYGYGYHYSQGYQQGYYDASNNLQQQQCDDWTNWCKGYNAGFSSYTDNSQQQEQTQGQSSFISVRGNNNIVGVKQSQEGQQSGDGYNPSGYDGSNPNCRALCLSIR
jgi:hypothetical protein